VTPETLARKGLVREGARIKVLGDGDLTQSLEVHAHAVSAAARKKIEAAGGSVRLIDAPGSEPARGAETE
jgi:large subunit ribosomal protein L15